MKNWWKKWRQRKLRKSFSRGWSDLREFVYLDEVSVTSLVASKLGKVPSEFTDTLTESTKAGLNSSIGASTPVLKSSIGSNIESSRTQDTKVVSKATIQATFKRLYEGVSDQLVLRPIHPSDPGPIINDVRKVFDPDYKVSTRDGWIVDQDRLERGSLVEVQVELQADPAFRLSAMVGTLAELTAESKELSAQIDQQGFEKIIEINRVLEKLMVGLVPLKCRIVDYSAVTIEQRDYLVHRKALQMLPAPDRPSSRDVFLVGVAEHSLFWKDIRRILFSNSRFRVLCRLNNDRLSTSWTPVKLTHVFGEIAPELERDMNLFSTGALQLAIESSAAQQIAAEPGFRAVVRFGELLSEALNIELDAEGRERIEAQAHEFGRRMTSVPDRRRAFDGVVELLAPNGTQGLGKDRVSELRVQASQECGLLQGGAVVQSQSTPVQPPSVPDDLFIDAEIIAIYW